MFWGALKFHCFSYVLYCLGLVIYYMVKFVIMRMKCIVLNTLMSIIVSSYLLSIGILWHILSYLIFTVFYNCFFFDNVS